MLGCVLLLQQEFVLARNRSRAAAQWGHAWSGLRGAFRAVASHSHVDTREWLVQVSGEKGKHREVCRRKLEPDQPRASVSWKTLPTAPCALTQRWDTEWGQRGALPPPLHCPGITVQAIARTSPWLPWDSSPSLERKWDFVWDGTDWVPQDDGSVWETSKLWSPTSTALESSRASGLIALTHTLGQDGLSTIQRDNTYTPLRPATPCTYPSGFGIRTLHCSPAPAAWQSPLQRSREQGLKRKSHTETKKLTLWKVIVLLLWVGESGREVEQGRGRRSFSKRCHSGATILGEPLPFCCQQAGAN